MLVIGIDPGIALTGYGIVGDDANGDLVYVAHGVISTPSNTPIDARLQQIYRELTALLKTHKPDSAGVEKLLFGKNVTNAIAVGQARGVAILALADQHVPVSEYTPAEIKQAVAGYGNADKLQVQEMVRLLLKLDSIPRPDDAADAIAIAITHLYAGRYARLTE